MRVCVLIGAFSVMLCGSPATAAAQPAVKVLISADMEGVAGVTSWPIDASAKGRDYAASQRLLAGEVNAAIEGAYDAGATEVIVTDAHGDFANLQPEMLDKRAQLVRGWPRPLGMVHGIARDFAAVVLIGYHAPEGTADAVLAHTFSGTLSLTLNGAPMSETGVSAAISGAFGVPVVFVSGDRATTEEARKLLGPAQTAVVKESIGFTSGVMLSPDAARKRIREGVALGVKQRKDIRPLVVTTPIVADIRFKDVAAAEFVSYIPAITRTASDTIRFTAADMPEASRFLAVIITMAAIMHQ